MGRVNKVREDGEILFVGHYHRYRQYDGSRNENFGLFDRMVLDLKEGRTWAVDLFVSALERKVDQGAAVCVVPSHKAGKSNKSGIAAVARKLSLAGRTDAVDALLRIKTIRKLSDGGNRNERVHLESIAYNDKICIAGMKVYLLDDVTTSGNSMRACREILLREGGAKSVEMMAVAKTSIEDSHKGWCVYKHGNKVALEDWEIDSDVSAVQMFFAEKKKESRGRKVESEYYPGKYKKYVDPSAEGIETFGKYGDMRLSYLWQHFRKVYYYMMLNGELENHLEMIQESAEKIYESTMNGYKYKYPAPSGNNFDEWYAYIRRLSEMAEDEVINDIVLM